MKFLKNIFGKSISTEVSVTSSNGFHLRPIAQFVALAKTFSCRVTATFKHKTVDAKEINSLLSLSLEQGDTFTINTKGEKAEDALGKLHSLLSDLMQQDKEIKQIAKISHNYRGEMIEGDIISQGIAIADTFPYTTSEIKDTSSSLCFDDALKEAMGELDILSQDKNPNADIYMAQKLLLSSLAKDHKSLSTFEIDIKEKSDSLLDTGMESKRADYRDIYLRVKNHLGFKMQLSFPDNPFVLLASDLLASEIEILVQTQVVGVVLQDTSIYSHSAILLRASGIPTLLADISLIPLHQEVIIDTNAGVVIPNPTKEDLEEANRHLQENKTKELDSANRRFDKAITRDGKAIKVLANISDIDSAKIAKDEGAEGIGLLRSEFMFTSKQPSLEDQRDAYIQIFELFNDITVRTLDVGGDKSLPYINIPLESNPFLGIRGVRLFRTHPEIMTRQLLAIFKASMGRKIKVMFPMVSTVREFIYTKEFAIKIAKKHDIDISQIEFGIMIEVPSVLFLLEEFNKVVDFYSIGTNDLAQYLFATERTHPLLKVDALSPVIFSAISIIVNTVNKPLSICGELAGDTKALSQLINLGVDTLSISPKNIAKAKEEIRDV